MDNEWAGWPRAWSEEKEQAHADKRALRLLTCPLKWCRRMHSCRRSWPRHGTCVALPDYRNTREEEGIMLVLLRFEIKRMIDEAETLDEATRERRQAARSAAAKRRRKLAIERAKAVLREARRREREAAPC